MTFDELLKQVAERHKRSAAHVAWAVQSFVGCAEALAILEPQDRIPAVCALRDLLLLLFTLGSEDCSKPGVLKAALLPGDLDRAKKPQ